MSESESTGAIVFSNNRNNFAWIFKYTLEVVTSPNGKVNFAKDVKSTPKHSLTLAAGNKDSVLSHVCFTVSIGGPTDTLAQLSYVGQDVRRIPPVLSKLYGNRVHALDMSYNCLTSLHELSNFPHLIELVLDNNQLSDTIVIPYIRSLHTLSLNKNNITNLEMLLTKIEHNLPNLRYLSLLGNLACPNQLSDSEKDEEDYQRYRFYVLYHLPHLQFLDSRPVSPDERREAAQRGKYMKVVRPSQDKYNVTDEDSSEESKNYSPLPALEKRASDHQGMYGKCRFRYIGKHSEGNRFIQNNDL